VRLGPGPILGGRFPAFGLAFPLRLAAKALRSLREGPFASTMPA
jgi:hypothetical protein